MFSDRIYCTNGMETSSNATYVIRTIESCPAVGYFFKREPAPNLVDAGPCYLCFCKENGTATCWERDRRRCDVERYHHHRVGRQSRYRRSFSNVFFRDATRDFFGKNLPQQCKPFESSFSDGCPPADWCVGCTICDCDSNGRWDCHILSFCDGKENKKKIKPIKNHRNKKAKKSLDYDNSIEVRPTKRAPTRITSKKTTTKLKTTKPPKKNVRKLLRAKPGNKTNTGRNKGPKNLKTKKRVSKKVTTRVQTKAMSRNHPRSNVSNGKIIKKIAVTRKPVRLNRNAVKGLKLNPNNSDTVKLGQKIVQQVMTTFKKILAKEIDKLNETKRTKVMDGKDCGGVKKRDKRTYNVRSNAVVRNKNKYNKPGFVRENYTNARVKRQILDQEQANLEKISVITLPTDINAVIPLSTVKEENSSAKKLPDNVTSVPFFTTQRDNYYKYSIKNDSSWTSATVPVKNITANNESYLENNFLISTESNNVLSDKIKNNVTKTINPDFNDLKFTKWYIIKIKNDERKKQVTRLLLSKPTTPNSFEYRKKIDREYYESKLQKKNLEPNVDVTKKYNLTTFAPTVYKKPCCTKSSKNTHNATDVTGLKNIIQNLFTELNKTNSVKRKKKSKVSVLKYVRKIFHKIFSKKKTGSHKIYGLGTKEDHTLQILCENIGPCKIRKNNRMILQYKLKQLNKETKTILKSIRTVKGLLHLLELPDRDKTVYMSKKSYFQSDIQKLGTVLKDYNDDDMNSSLTFTQKTQIDYIKKTTQTFIDSVKKFADILTDILAMIKPNVKYVQSLKPPPKKQNYTASLNKIKKILYQYNIMQNTFMRKMYELINGEQKKTTTTERTQLLGSDRNRNRSDVIEKYSKNIIENLRKLKSIAQVLSSKRKKRELSMGDDAIDYLLTLMELLIKQNNPLRTVPANGDGIDLLIDAIKNAPDIKPMKKQDFYNMPINPLSKLAIVETSDLHTSDSSFDSKRLSNEEKSTDSEDNINGQYNVLTDVNSKPEALTFQAIDDDVTQKVYYRIFNQHNSNDYEATTEYNSITKKRSNEELEKIGFDKFESYLGDPKKLEVETSYLEDDAIGDITTDNAPVTNKTDVTYHNIEDHTVFDRRVPERSTAYIATSNDSSSESQDSMNDKRSKLEWIEETFDREIRMINNTSNSLPKRTSTQSTQPTPITTEKNIENNSDLTKEEHTEHTEHGVKRTPKNVKNHDVLYEKHVQFLNSLDYGTEKSADFEEADSKDDARSDGEFQTYFV